ncbi:Di-sulfide bridge nucleocytoplasmic transport domain-containing protein [Pseudomassariella vexata]|uniref:Di-sulfide bridge nucleocytoplasmic transport domain-domain-containing protein n=1 Tax=Pseudomassariella vexata TaxID=1141098 RepID=A0A1Y2D8X2_9PEZI|nr:Di-sulfide bridge nucleocytoplasmic transport domain-containing protein [Pseudomassariella vexata]ORY55712.1 Di-sulfide bridge nucleocytoplasmic transport domain-domain-containing protein [Pseudomassariella vexata]
MEKRTHESPMEWEYQTQGPMDPTSPFVTSTRKAQQNIGVFGSQLGTFGQSSFSRTQSSPYKPLSATPGHSSFASNPQLQRTATAPAFRNSAFTTPRKPLDHDVFSEVSAAESSPAATDGSDCPDTPEMENSRSFGQMAITPARNRALLSKKASGKGEIPRVVFNTRDKVRKRKRRQEDKDIGSYRLPYKQADEWDESEGADSDDSAFRPNDPSPNKTSRARGKKGWFTNFLSTIQKHPYAPAILGYWLQLAFNLVIVGIVTWVMWIIISGFKDDFWAARQELRAGVVEEMAKCAKDYAENRCAPKEQRLPAMNLMCEEWESCMNQDPDKVRRVQLGAKNIVEIINEIFETMHWKTLAVFFLLFAMLCFSGASLFKSTPGNFTTVPHQPQHSQTANVHMLAQSQQQQGQYYSMMPMTPRHFKGGLLRNNDETPDTDASPSGFRMLPPPSFRRNRSPSKEERARSPTKSRSPTKRY